MQKFIVNGVSYDSLDAMPPDVRRQYERAMETLKNRGPGAGPGPQRTVTTVPGGGTKIEVNERRVLYNIDGKTYDDPAQLPPEIKARIDEAMATGRVRTEPGRDVTVVRVHADIRRDRGMGPVLLWLLLGAAVVIILASILF